jgi:hypothetical protein
LTHICEALELYPSMQWGSPNSIGHYLDLSSAVLGLRLFPFWYFGTRRGWLRRFQSVGGKPARHP